MDCPINEQTADGQELRVLDMERLPKRLVSVH